MPGVAATAVARGATGTHEASDPGLASRILEPNRRTHVRLGTDMAALGLGCLAAVLTAGPSPGTAPSRAVLVGTSAALVLALMHIHPGPDDRLKGSLLETFTHVLAVVSLAMMLAVAADSLLGSRQPVRLSVLLWSFTIVSIGIARTGLLYLRQQVLASGRHATPTLIVGAGVVGSRLVQRFTEQPSYGLRPIGFLDADPLEPRSPWAGPSLPILGGPEDLAEMIVRTGAEHVILAFSSEPDHLLVRQVSTCHELGVGVSLVPRLYESISEHARLDHVGGLPLLTLRAVDPRGWQFALKHTMDRTLAALALIVLAPVLALTAFCVRVSSSGPILFRQRRVGRDGREFDLLKFRTMRIDGAPQPAFELPLGIAPGGVEGLDRRTPIGRLLRSTCIDELPQLINVLRGEMSLVGPRPERPEFVVRFSRDVPGYEDRHRVRSGITGWAQVHGLRGQTSIADRVEWDAFYIRNWSLRLDVRILVMTVCEIVRHRG